MLLLELLFPIDMPTSPVLNLHGLEMGAIVCTLFYFLDVGEGE